MLFFFLFVLFHLLREAAITVSKCKKKKKTTVRLLEPGHLEEDYTITTFFENKKFSRFFLQTNQKRS